MKALTLWQPWATFMALGYKRIETRPWYTGYRGRLAIHAAARPMVKDLEPSLYFMQTPSGRIIMHDFPLGVVMGTCELVNCLPTDPEEVDHRVNRVEYPYGDYRPGRFMWITANMKPFENPIPAKGRQKLWNWEEPP